MRLYNSLGRHLEWALAHGATRVEYVGSAAVLAMISRLARVATGTPDRILLTLILLLLVYIRIVL